MNKLRLVFEVASWEFNRFFRVKDVIVTLLILLFLTALLGAGVWFAQRGSADKPKISVINASLLLLDSAPHREFDFKFPQVQEEAALRESVGRRELDGLLIIKSNDSAELVTCEKHQRVTEQIISAISPQVWMDGKILGISAIGIALIVVYGGFSLVISGVVWWLAGLELALLFPLVDPLLTLSLLALALLGLLFWNCFFAAIAATVDDPNTSSRSVFMFLPFLPVAITVAGLRNPDSMIMKVLGMFPLTSPAALSARLVVTEVAAWEVFVAIGLLLGTIWLLRKAAFAKIFRLAMLMQGKEPSLAELWRWLFES